VTTQRYSPDQNVAYVGLVPEIDGIGEAFTATLEIPGYGLAVGPSRGGALYVASDQAATVTRYDVSRSGQIEQGGELSFAAYGVGVIFGYSGQFQFIDPGKAYYLDSESLQALVWNPTEMTVTASLDLSALALPGFYVAFDGEPTRRDRELVMVAGYYDAMAARVAQETRVAFIDTATDTIVVVSDPRCGYVTHSIEAPNGDIYLASDTWAVSIHEASVGDAPASCMLRIRAGEHVIDPDFHGDLAAMTGSPVAGSLLPGAGNKAFLRGFDTTLFQGDASSYEEIWEAAAWRWYELELGSEAPATVVAELEPGGPSSLQLPFEGRTFTNSSDADYASSVLLDLAHASGPHSVGSVPGIPVGIVRLY
jgi:hypothetical protein